MINAHTTYYIRTIQWITALLTKYFRKKCYGYFDNYYLKSALNKDAEHSSESMLLAPCLTAVERPFFPRIQTKQQMLPKVSWCGGRGGGGGGGGGGKTNKP